MARRILTVTVPGPAGRLEALLEEPEDGESRKAALVCHPHPNHGGTMRNKVVYRTARALRHEGAVVLRFNFRGVGASEGSWGGGDGELDDARSALDFLRERYPDLPYTLAGFSFGAGIILELGCENADATRLIALGFPLTYQDREYVRCPAPPRFFVHSTQDEYAPREKFEAFYSQLSGNKHLTWIESRNHFFDEGLDELEAAVRSLPLGPSS